MTTKFQPLELVKKQLRRTIQQAEWITPEEVFYLGCCDCGMVHRLQFRIRNGEIQFRAFHATRATRERRKMKSFRFKKAGR